MLHRNCGVIDDFIKSKECSRKAEGKLDARLDFLIDQEKIDWTRPEASSLSDGLYVVRFTDENRKQLRVFGHFCDVHHCFVMTLTGYEKDGIYFPSEYLKKSNDNRKFVEQGFFQKTVRYADKCDHEECLREEV